MNLFFTLLIAALAAVSSFLPSTGKVYDNSTRYNGFKRVTRRGYYTILMVVLLIICTGIQNYLNDKDQINKSKIQKRSFDSSLTVMKEKFENSNLRTILSITETQNRILGKYGYMLDSKNLELKRIVRDSSKTRIILTENSTLSLCAGKQIELLASTKDMKTFRCYICSYGSTSTSPNLSFDILLADSLLKTYSFYGTRTMADTNIRFPTGHEYLFKFDVDTSMAYKNLILYIHGSYNNSDASIKNIINNIYRYNLQEKYSDQIIGENKDGIIKYIKSQANSN